MSRDSAAFAQAIESAAIGFRGTPGTARAHERALFSRRRWRRVILVERARQLGTEALVGEFRHLQNHEPARCVGVDLVPDAHGMARSHGVAVHANVSGGAGILGLSARFEDACSAEPAIDADRVHGRGPSVDQTIGREPGVGAFRPRRAEACSLP